MCGSLLGLVFCGAPVSALHGVLVFMFERYHRHVNRIGLVPVRAAMLRDDNIEPSRYYKASHRRDNSEVSDGKAENVDRVFGVRGPEFGVL